MSGAQFLRSRGWRLSTSKGRDYWESPTQPGVMHDYESALLDEGCRMGDLLERIRETVERHERMARMASNDAAIKTFLALGFASVVDLLADTKQ